MSNDRELLEAAAKAAGMQIEWTPNYGGVFLTGHPCTVIWRPLTDDGDALRLAVKLGMTVSVENDIGAVCATAGWVAGKLLPGGAGIEAFEGEARAATRRAIVRAAAEIGRAAPKDAG
jgi:hypothetical protein